MEKAQLAQAIHQLFQASQSEERQRVEHELNKLEANQDQHLRNVLELIHDNQNPDIASVKLSIAVYVRNFVRKIINQSSVGLQTPYIQSLMELIYGTLTSATIEFNIKRHLFLVFESLLMIYQAQERDSNKLFEFYSNLFSNFQGLLGQQNTEVTKGALLICQAALQSVRQASFLNKVFPGLAKLLCSLAENYINFLSKDLMVIAASSQSDLSLENPTIQSILASLDLLQEWVNIHESILERWESKKFFGFSQFASNANYSAVFGQIIGIVVNVQAQGGAHTFISLTGMQKLDHLLNKIKIKSLECMNYIFRYIFDMVSNETKLESPFLSRGLQLCPTLIVSLVDIAQRRNIEELAEDETYSDIIVESLESLCLFVGEKEFYDHFVKFSRILLVNVCLTLMRTSKSEYDQMIKDPDSFVNLALDTCDKQKSKIIKTHSAKLLEGICDNIDGAVSFITLFTCQSISLALDPVQTKVEENFYEKDYLFFKESLFLNSPPEITSETCLVALTAISYILPRRNDLVPLFEQVLAKNIDKILNEGSILLRARMSLLLGYYADMLFLKYDEAFNKVIDFLIKSVALLGDQKVVALQSADTLNTIISDNDLIPRLEPQLPRLMDILNECNLRIQIKLYFNFLLDFVKHYHHAIGDSIVPFVRSLVQRIQIELKNCHEKGEKNNLVINKTWNIIRQINELDSFIPTYYDAIENELKPLFEYMVDPEKIEFEDDIILTLKTFIKRTGRVSETLWTLFPHLYKVFIKSKKTFGNLLDTLNYYLLHGKEYLALNRELLVIIVNMASESLFSTEPNITIQNSEGAILFQLLFQVYAGTQCLDEYFEQILNIVVKRMTQSPMQDHLKRHLLCVFLTAMAYNPTYTIGYLVTNNLVEDFFKQLFSLSSTFVNTYERKIYIIGLSNALNASNLPPAMVQNLLEIMQQIIKMLNVLKDAEAKALKKAGKKEIKEDDDEEEDDDDDDDEDDDEEDDEDNEEEENEDEDIQEDHEKTDNEESKGEPTMEGTEETKVQKQKHHHDNAEEEDEDTESEDDDDDVDEVFDLNVTMDLLNAPFKKTDEFAIFNTVLRNLHQRDPTYVNNLVQQLQEKEKKFLKEHIETKRIKIEHKGIETEVARRIIKVKRRGGVGSGASGSVPK